MKLADLNKLLNSELTTKIKSSSIEHDELLIDVEVENISNVLLFLKTDSKCSFRQLVDIVAADYPGNDKRFRIVYLLLSHKNNARIKISIVLNSDEKIGSITKIYPSANWMEREIFDMYGIKFKNHPDLRRILTDYNFKGFPLRKDFPWTGFNEVRYSEKHKKVIYEPVKLEQEYRDFDFDSPWEGTKYMRNIKTENKDG